MKNIRLYIPKVEEYWYEEKVEKDPLSMHYNAGYDVDYFGYHYDTGCIDFPEERWQEVYQKRKKEKKYFAYIKDLTLGQFVGYVDYNYDSKEKKYYCGVLIEAKHRGKGYSKIALQLLCQEAKKNGIRELYDNFEINRPFTLKIFESVGFKVIKKEVWKKFGEDVEGVVVGIKL